MNSANQGSSEAALQRKTRILVLTSTFPRWEADSEPRFVLDLSKLLSKNAEILVVAPHAAGAAREESLEGVRVRRFRYFFSAWQTLAYAGGITARLRDNWWRILLLPFFFISFAWTLRRIVREWSPDVIHANWIIPQAFVACLVTRSVPILCTSHGSDLLGLSGPFFGWIKRWTLRRCDRINVVSNSMLAKMRKLVGNRNIDVIPMGTDLSHLFTPGQANQLRENKQLVFVGRLVASKGVNFLLDAIAELNDPEIRLTVAGHGPLLPDLSRQAETLGISDRVEFLGGVRQSELPRIFQRSALAVFPYCGEEGFGLVIVEAMGCGCPVIASDLSAVRENINPGVTGLLVPAGNARELARQIRSALADELLRERLALAALTQVRKRFDWLSVGSKYERILDELGATNGASR